MEKNQEEERGQMLTTKGSGKSAKRKEVDKRVSFFLVFRLYLSR